MTAPLDPVLPVREKLLAVELLSTPDYRNYWLGSTSFALGIWAFLVSMSYSARVLSDSPFKVSLVSVAYFTPMFLLALPPACWPTPSTARRRCHRARAVCGDRCRAVAARVRRPPHLPRPRGALLPHRRHGRQRDRRAAGLRRPGRPARPGGRRDRARVGAGRHRPGRRAAGRRRPDQPLRPGSRLPVLRRDQRLLRRRVPPHQGVRGTDPAARPSARGAGRGDALPPSYTGCAGHRLGGDPHRRRRLDLRGADAGGEQGRAARRPGAARRPVRCRRRGQRAAVGAARPAPRQPAGRGGAASSAAPRPGGSASSSTARRRTARSSSPPLSSPVPARGCSRSSSARWCCGWSSRPSTAG